MSTNAASSITCSACNGGGPLARTDWAKFKADSMAACPDCGATSQPAPPVADSAHVDEVLDQLREVLLSLSEDEQLGALAGLERRAQELDPRNRPEPESEVEIPRCPSCGAESRHHRYARRLMVCQSAECSAIWSKSRRGKVQIEAVV